MAVLTCENSSEAKRLISVRGVNLVAGSWLINTMNAHGVSTLRSLYGDAAGSSPAYGRQL